MPPCSQGDRGAVPLPCPPIARVAFQHGNVVDPYFEGPLGGDDDLLLALRPEEGLCVVDPVGRVLGAGREAAVLRHFELVR